ncbi:nitrilase family protein-like protein [Boeremia exigua]|uniref:nitrilase family protein-like protein n=1 Tax=Boeremia exigua TaxID=749465 RepID=UPI001E8CA982|nr:nitrilase family protein-like protein [Boeremia exigua]KAH6642963.1 nitrilase family protein-like protein [Boeremia exigua]
MMTSASAPRYSNTYSNSSTTAPSSTKELVKHLRSLYSPPLTVTFLGTSQFPLTPPAMSQLLKKSLKLALVQLASGADKTANLHNARTKVLEAARAGANLVVLPECFNSPYGTKYFDTYAETLQPSPPSASASPTFHALAQLAREAGVYLVGGSIPERDHADAKTLYNTSLTFGPGGDLIATHRKVHLFDIDIPGKIKFVESDVLSPGNKITIVDLPEYGKVGIAICYDIRFPELATIAARKGAFLLIYPGAFNLTTGALHWELLARARATDNQVFVGLCSPARDMKADYNAWGHSMVVDPNAHVLQQLEEKEGIIVQELQAGKIEETRKGIPLYTQRRFDVYPDVSEGGRFKE